MSRWLELFSRYGLLTPADDLARKLSRRATREVRRLDTPDPSTRDISAALSNVHQRYERLVQRALKETRRYEGWRPLPEDAFRLLAALAITHRELGFEFEPHPSNVDSETRFHRDGLIAYYLQEKEGRTVKEAAQLATKAIDAGIKSGRYTTPDTGELSVRRKGSANHLAKDYGQRRLARRGMDPQAEKAHARDDLPPTIRNAIEGHEHYDEAFSEIMRLTVWNYG